MNRDISKMGSLTIPVAKYHKMIVIGSATISAQPNYHPPHPIHPEIKETYIESAW